jgi:hypothetical protein
MSDAVISPPNSSSDCLDLDLTPSCSPLLQAITQFTLDALLVTPSGFFWVIMVSTLDAVIHCSQHGKLSLWRFLHFYAPKKSELLPFPDFTPKVAKITKGTI